MRLSCPRQGDTRVPDDIELEKLYDHDATLQLICAARPTDHQGGDQANVAINTCAGLDNALVNRVLTGILGAHPDHAVGTISLRCNPIVDIEKECASRSAGMKLHLRETHE